jgi:hypothetical protein
MKSARCNSGGPVCLTFRYEFHQQAVSVCARSIAHVSWESPKRFSDAISSDIKILSVFIFTS